MRWNVLYERIRPELEAEAEDNNGQILIKPLNEIIEDNIGYDDRTKKRVRNILTERKILKAKAPGVYYFIPYLELKEREKKETEAEELTEASSSDKVE